MGERTTAMEDSIKRDALPPTPADGLAEGSARGRSLEQCLYSLISTPAVLQRRREKTKRQKEMERTSIGAKEEEVSVNEEPGGGRTARRKKAHPRIQLMQGYVTRLGLWLTTFVQLPHLGIVLRSVPATRRFLCHCCHFQKK